ncbi:Pentatricopeptide repeat-containing protein [Acorus calamus]|uniref:Pentatricopeptide repeat-containing protein n=1 Tax=Acorus calamus TaxID=4465 RepID=A0AAV9CCJ4_ACOCL|nr:Pentatricopeptide repeat-containing protein [Acorus calamus]
MGEFAIIFGSPLIPPDSNPHHPNLKPSKNLYPKKKKKKSLLIPSRSPSLPPPLLLVDSHRHPRSDLHRNYHARLASRLAGLGKLEDFLMVVETALASSGGDVSRFVSDLDMGMVWVGVLGVMRNGGLEAVVGFLGRVERLGIPIRSLVDESAMAALVRECRLLVEGGRLEEFVVLMEILSGYQISIKYIVDPMKIINIFIDKRDPNMAVRYASVLPQSQFLFCSIIQEFGRKGDLASALTSFEGSKMKSGGHNMYVYRSIIDACGLCGESLKSRSIFEELMALKIIPNVFVFNSLMNTNAHDLRYTLHVYGQMQSLGISLDIASYNILLKACYVAKRIDLAQDIYEEVKHLASRRVLHLDVITYSTMIKVFAEAKMLQMAFHVKEDMLNAGVCPNIITWSSLIDACASRGLVDKAIQVFDEMLLTGCEPNSQCCNILLSACVQSYQYDRAFRLFYSWKEAGFEVNHTKKAQVYRNIEMGAVSANDTCVNCVNSYVNDTHHFQGLTKVVSFKPTVATYNILMKACGSDYYRARAIMDEMRMVGLSPNHISWSTLIDICGSSHNMKGAMQSFKTMRDVGIKPDVVAYTTAIKACVKNKDSISAFSLFEEMKRHQLQPNLVTYNTLLRARSRYGSLHEIQQCLSVYQDMRSAGYNPNDYYLKELIEEWCEEVIITNDKRKSLPGPIRQCNEPGAYETQSLFLEKVAVYLQKDVVDHCIIDVRGLSKVESRIVVLSVLRMIKERNILGHPVKDDMTIIIGDGKKGSTVADHEVEVEHAIFQVLQDTLGLVVLSGPPQSPGSDLENAALHNNDSFARKPKHLRRLKVTKESLHNWLQKKDEIGKIHPVYTK